MAILTWVMALLPFKCNTIVKKRNVQEIVSNITNSGFKLQINVFIISVRRVCSTDTGIVNFWCITKL